MLKAKSTKAYFWKSGGTILQQVLSFSFSVVLARNLSPSDFGLFAATFAIIQIAKTGINLGYGEALVQNQNNNDSTYSSVFNVNVVIGLGLYAILFISAPWFAEFYEDYRLSLIIRILGTILLFDSLSIVQLSILSQNLEFDKIVKRDIITQLLAGCSAIVSLYLGLDIYALVVQALVLSLANTLLLWRVSKWRPIIFKFDKKELLKLQDYTKYAFFTILINSGVRNLYPLVIAKSFNTSTLGFYKRSDSLVKLISNTINQSIRQVLFASLSKLKNNINASVRVFEITLELVIIFSVFITAIVFLGSDLFFLEILGPQWAKSLDIFKIIVFLGFLEPFQLVIHSAILSKGLSKIGFHSQFLKRGLDLISLGIGLVFGFVPFLYGILISAIFGAALYVRIGNKAFDNAVSRVINRSSVPIIILIISVIALQKSLIFENLWFCATLKIMILMLSFSIIFFLLRKKFILSTIKLLRGI